MSVSLRRTLLRCTCQRSSSTASYSSSSASLYSARLRSASFSSSARTSALAVPARPQVPWFVEEPSPSSSGGTDPASATEATLLSPSPSSPLFVALPPPSHLPAALHALHDLLARSPLLEPASLVYIHAREADPENAWTEWIVVASLRPGREGGLRGAIESIRAHLTASPISLSPSPAPSPFSPPSDVPIITGLPTSLSSHARSRAKAQSASRIEQNQDGWAMLDSGAVVVNVMTLESREKFDIEGLWKKVAKGVKDSSRDDADE